MVKLRIWLVAVLWGLLLLPGSALRLGPMELSAAPHRFQLAAWEARALPIKWAYKLWDLRPGEHRTPEARHAAVLAYFGEAGEVVRLQGQVQRVAAVRAAAEAPPLADLEQELARARRQRDGLAREAEEAIESLLDGTLRELGFGSRLGVLFPPVDFAFDDPPLLLATSPRDRISLETTVLLLPDLSVSEMEALERRVEEATGLSALVVGTGGLATYPAIVSPNYGLLWTLQTVAHEWAHQYLFFRPLGRNYFSHQDMVTLNETVADMVGLEVGALLYERITGQAPPAPPEPREEPSGAPDTFDFTREMRRTRLEVDALLAAGKTEEAEAYMEQRRQRFVEAGYAIRRINQAYFAFHGSYALSPASVSPIRGQLQELRALAPSLQAFVDTVARASSYQEFLEVLERERAAAARRAS